MEDNKKTNTPTGNGPQVDSNDKPESLDLHFGKSTDDLKKGAQEQMSEFGSAGVDDINKNLGSFGNTVVKPADSQPQELKLDVDAAIVEKASKEEINFERFKKTKREEKAAKTKFGERVSIMLRSKKGLTTTWIIEMLIMVITVAAGIVVACLCKDWWNYNGDGPVRLTQGTFKVGYIFCWIAMFPCVVPLVYLLTTWFIGINQVASSRLYHFIFWGFAGFGLICLLIGLGLICPTFVGWLQFNVL